MLWKEEFAKKLKKEMQMRSINNIDAFKDYLLDYLTDYFGTGLESLVGVKDHGDHITFKVVNKKMNFYITKVDGIQIHGVDNKIVANIMVGENKLQILEHNGEGIIREFQILDLDKIIENNFKDAL